jgi:hypothetical protein
MGWVIIVAILVMAFIIIEKFVHFSHWNSKFWTIAVISILGFVALSFFGVAQANAINLNTLGGFFNATKLYFSWLVNAFGNIKDITGNAVRMNWFPNMTG